MELKRIKLNWKESNGIEKNHMNWKESSGIERDQMELKRINGIGKNQMEMHPGWSWTILDDPGRSWNYKLDGIEKESNWIEKNHMGMIPGWENIPWSRNYELNRIKEKKIDGVKRSQMGMNSGRGITRSRNDELNKFWITEWWIEQILDGVELTPWRNYEIN